MFIALNYDLLVQENLRRHVPKEKKRNLSLVWTFNCLHIICFSSVFCFASLNKICLHGLMLIWQSPFSWEFRPQLEYVSSNVSDGI